MELKAIIAIALVVFIIGGLIFLKVRSRKKYLSEIWQLITQSPEQFKGGSIWGVIVNIHDAVRAIGRIHPLQGPGDPG